MGKPASFLIAILCALVPQFLQGQQLPASGSRVRVVDPPPYGQPVAIGTFVRLAGDSIIITDSTGALHQVHLGRGRRWEVSEGMRRHNLRGMGIGLLVGAGIGAAIGLASYEKPDCSQQQFLCLDFGPGVAAAAGAVMFAVPGMVIGGIAGSAKREQWRRVPQGTSLIVAPTAARTVRVGLSLQI